MPSPYEGSSKDWWYSDLTPADIQNVQNALCNLIIEEEYTRADMTNDIQLALTVLPKIKLIDLKWKSVQTRHFNIANCKAHKHFYQVIYDLLDTKQKLGRLLKDKGYTWLKDAGQEVSANKS